MAYDSKKDMEDTYDKLSQSRRELNQAIEKNRQEEDKQRLNVISDEQAKKRQAAGAETSQKRKDKSAKAYAKFEDKHQQMKDSSLRGYDKFETAMMEIAGLGLAMSNAISAEIWAEYAGPLMDVGYEKVTPVVGEIVGLPANAVKAWVRNAVASFSPSPDMELPAELRAVSPSEMIKLTGDGKLEFERFVEKFENTRTPREVLERLDDLYERATRMLLKNQGYERDSEGVYKIGDGAALNDAKFQEIIKLDVDVQALVNQAMQREPAPSVPNASPGPR